MTKLNRAVEGIGNWLFTQGVDISQPISPMVMRRAILETRGTDIRTFDKWTKLLTQEGKLKEETNNLWRLNI